MAKRSPELGGAGRESSYVESTTKRLDTLDSEIGSSGIDEGKKDHLLAASAEIRKALDDYNDSEDKKVFKNDVHAKISGLEAEFTTAKHDKRKKETTKPVSSKEFLKEYKGKKDREEEVAKLLQDLDEVQKDLVSKKLLFSNFGKYKKIKDAIPALVGLKDKTEYEAKKAELEVAILDLLDAQPEEKKPEPEVKTKVETVAPEVIAEEEKKESVPEKRVKKEKTEHKVKKVDHRKKEDDDGGQEGRIERHEQAVERWNILRGIMNEMIGRDSINTDTFNAIESSLKLAYNTNDANEYEEAMVDFERNFDSIVNHVPAEIRLEYYSQLNGNDPVWKKSVSRTREAVISPVVEWEKDRDEKLDLAKKRWKLLNSGVIEKMDDEDRQEYEENIEAAENALAVLEKAGDESEYLDQIREFERNFAEIRIKGLPKVSRADQKAYKNQESSLRKTGKADKKDLAVEKKDDVVEEPRELSVDEQRERDNYLEEANKKYRMLEVVAKEKLGDAKWRELGRLVVNTEESLSFAKTKWLQEYEAQKKRFENLFPQLLAKVGDEVRQEMESRLAAGDTAPTTDVETQKKYIHIQTRKKALQILANVLEQNFYARDRKDGEQEYSYNETGDYLTIRNASSLLSSAAKNLADKKESAYTQNMNEFDQAFKKLWGAIHRFKDKADELKNEFNKRLRGEETDWSKKEKERYEKHVSDLENGLPLFELAMDEKDKNLRTKYAAELQAVKDAVADARANANAEWLYEEKLDKIIRNFGKLSFPDDLREVKNNFYSKLAEKNRGAVKTTVVETASPEQKIYLQSYERDFGILEKIIENGATQDVKDSIKWRIDVVRTTIEKAKKEMSQHNKLDETVLFNMQGLLEDLQKLDPKLHAEFMEKIAPKAAQPAAGAVPEKKGFWARAKDFGKAIFNKEVGKTVVKTSYDTVTTLFGVKTITDLVGGIFGKGDIANYMEGRADSKKYISEITGAYQDLLSSAEKTKKKETLTKNEQIAARIETLKTKVEAANISADAKKQIVDRLWAISIKHKTETEKSMKERDKEVKELLESYIYSKVSGAKIAKDVLNLGLTVSGLSLLRGVAYVTASALERFQQGRKEEAREISGSLAEKKDTTKMTKDIIASTARETARSLTFRGAKEGSSGVTKTMDFVKALGTIARGVGIFNLTVLHGDTPKESIDNLIRAIKEGDATIISDSFVQNGKRVIDNMQTVGSAVANPIDTAESVWNRVSGQTDIKQEVVVPKHNVEIEKEEIAPKIQITSVEEAPKIPEVSVFSVQNFAAENGLSKESLAPLQQLVEKYPSLNKEETLNRILDASKVGDGVKFHHGDLVRGDVDTLIEAEGERRSVIFEELVKAKDYEAAAKYLESQNFSSRHKTYLEDYIGKGTHEDYLNFAKQYDEKPDKKMVYGLFRAMQGKGNTDLANAGLVRSATLDRAGRTISLQGGELKYFGLNEKGEPILSGQGRAVVKETIIVETGNENGSTGELSVNDQLEANANIIKDIKGEGPYTGDFENAPAHDLSVEERAVLAQVEADKARFAKMGEDAINISDRARAGKPVGTYITGADQHEAAHDEVDRSKVKVDADGKRIEITETKITTVDTVVGKTVKTYTASGETVQPEKGYVKPETKTGSASSPEVQSVSAAKPIAEATAQSKSSEVETNNQITEAEKIENLKLMYKNYEAMGNYIISQRDNFIFVGSGKEILNNQIRNEPTMVGFKDYIKQFLAGDINNVNEKTVKNVEAMKQTLDAFNHMDKNPNWYNSLEGDELKLFLDTNKNNLHMMANDSHIARITDKQGKGFLLSDSEHTFVVKDDKLLKMKDGAVVEEYSYEDAVKLVKNLPIEADK